MRVLITGVNGLLGSNLARFLSNQGVTVVGSGRSSKNSSLAGEYVFGDLSNPAFSESLMTKARPDAVINCVGLADVALCEKDPDLARLLNSETASNIARASAQMSCRFLHISTDHLFKGDQPMRTELDAPEPINAYARSKFEGEQRVLSQHPASAVIRTSFYGWSPIGHAPTFAEWLHTSLSEQAPIKLFTDFYFNALEVSFLADALMEVLPSTFQGVLNIASPERCSKYDFGQAMSEVFGLSMKQVTASPFGLDSLSAKRPKDLSLSIEKFTRLFKTHLPTLKEGLLRLKAEMPTARKVSV